MSLRRKITPAFTTPNADRNAARQRAYSRLAKEFPDRWRALYAEELDRRGLQAVSR